MDPRTAHLRSFVAVAEERHFGRAAVRLGIAQPAVSRHVRTLETALDAVLLERTSRQTRLTAAGEAALEGARRVLVEVDALERTVRDAAGGVGGRIVVAFVASTVSTWLPALKAVVGERHPQLQLEVSQVPVAATADRLRRGEIDVAVTRGVDEDGLYAEVVHREPMLAVLPPGHPLSGRDVVEVRELAGDALVLSAARHWPAGHAALLAALRDSGWPCEDVRDAAGPAVALALVAAGEGVHLRPRSGLAPGSGLACAELDGIASDVLAVRRAGPAPPAYATIVEELRRVGEGVSDSGPPPGGGGDVTDEVPVAEGGA